MKTVLVATDLSDRSDIAVARAVHIARRQDARLHVLQVIDDEIPRPLADHLRKEAESIILASLASLEEAGPIRSQVSVVLGDPAEEIAIMAMEVQADLVVMGRHRRRGLAEFFTGTTVERMAQMANLPLLIVTRAADSPYDGAVVGVDFSKCATNAVSIAAELVGNAGLSLVHSYHLPSKALSMRADRHGSLSACNRERRESELRREVDAWAAAIGVNEGGSKVMLREGAAVNVLPQVARETGSDLICIGAHSRRRLPSTVLGSTAADLLSKSDFDILIAPL